MSPLPKLSSAPVMFARVRASLGGLDREVAWVWLTSVVAQAVFWSFARVPPIEKVLHLDADRTIVPVLAHWGASFAVLGLSSLFVIKLALRRSLAEHGLQAGDLRLALKGALLTYVVFSLPSVVGGGTMADVAAEYPLSKAAAASVGTFAVYSLAYGLYYVGWEIHFRGFMLFGLARKLGPWPAILAQTVPSVLVHAGKPPGEVFASIIAGLVWGWLAWESRSILGPLLAHWALGVTNDLSMIGHFHGFGR